MSERPEPKPPRAGRERSSSSRPVTIVVWLAVLIAPQLAAFAWPEVAELLEYDRTAIAAGEVWRLATGHLVHWSPRHFALDAAALVALAFVMVQARLPGFGAIAAGAMLAISGALWLVRPDLTEYRGLSGLDSALFAGAAVGLTARLEGLGRTLAWGSLALFGAKLTFEAATGSAVFLQGSEVVYEAHLAGGLVGLVLVGLRHAADRGNRAHVATARKGGRDRE